MISSVMHGKAHISLFLIHYLFPLLVVVLERIGANVPLNRSNNTQGRHAGWTCPVSGKDLLQRQRPCAFLLRRVTVLQRE